jgi:hypothetical protein
MKYLIIWGIRRGAVDPIEIDIASRAHKLIERIGSERGIIIENHIGRIDGKGGIAIIEIDDPIALSRIIQSIAIDFDVDIIPIIDIQQFIEAGIEAARIHREIIGKGGVQ